PPTVHSSTDRNMFHAVHTLKLNHYIGPPSLHETDSDVCTNSFFVSFPKGASPSPEGRSSLKLSGTLRCWNHFTLIEFYSPFKTISKETIASLLDSEAPPGTLPPSLLG